MLKENLTMLRGINGYSQEQLAERIGISRQAYAKWESGATIPDVEKCRRLAEVYGVTVDALLKTEQVDGAGVLPPAPKGKNVWGSVVMNERGQLVIPKAAREHFGFEPGQRFIVLSEDTEGLALVPAELFEEKMRRLTELARTGE